jgi:hypothetical protein
MDLAGNTGNASFTVKVDKAAPAITITSPLAAPYKNVAQVAMDWTLSDTVSGVASVSAKLDGTNVSKGQVVDLFFLDLGQHTLIVSAADNAGNQGIASLTFALEVTAQSLLGSIDRLLAMGAIDNNGIANSLRAKLGKNANQVNAFLNELDAQKGKHITPQAYDILRAGALYLIGGTSQP